MNQNAITLKKNIKGNRNGHGTSTEYERKQARRLKILFTALVIACMFIISTLEVYAETDKYIGFDASSLALEMRGENLLKITDNHYQFETDFTRVDFMMDDLRGTDHLAYNVSLYSGKYIKNSGYTDTYDYTKKYISGKPAHVFAFERSGLEHAPDLKGHFLYIEVELERQVLLSLHIASDNPIDAAYWMGRLRDTRLPDTMDGTLASTEEIGTEANSDSDIETKTEMNTETSPEISTETSVEISTEISPSADMSTSLVYENVEEHFTHELTQTYYDETFVNNDSVTWGIFDPTTHYELTFVENIEDSTGINLDIILEYYDLGYLPRIEKMREITDSGRVLELTYQTSKYGTFNADALYEVLDGKHDDMIQALIVLIKDLDRPVLFRPNNEMNGDWCSYNAMYTHKDTQVFRTFWRWLHDRFEEEGVENVIWVWNPNWGDFPGAQWNHYLNYFPGEEYVDVIGLTGYNTGTYYKDESWRSFTEIYYPMVEEYNKHFVGFPFMITEFGSSATGGNKGAWIQTALNEIEALGIKAAVWWNHVDYDTRLGVISRGYKFDEDPDVMRIFKMNFEEK